MLCPVSVTGVPGRGYDDWFYVVEPSGERRPGRIVAGDGRVLVRRPHGYAARLCVEDRSGDPLPVATWLRAAATAGAALEATGDGTARPLRVTLGSARTPAALLCADAAPSGGLARLETLELDGPALAAAAPWDALHDDVTQLLRRAAGHRPGLPEATVERAETTALFFESLMASDLPHNDQEISQGVLHMLSAIADRPVRPLKVTLKMPAGDPTGAIRGLDRLAATLAEEPVHLVCLTLLEDYFDGAVRLIAELRRLGCHAHVAVGGVMPTLCPEHVAAHLPDVTFVCRGAGEYFVPRLCAIVGSADRRAPFSDDQCAALMAMDGLIAIDRAGQRLVTGHPARTVEVEQLGAVELDLSHLEPRHLEGGIEISTARGCLHHCSFCSIIGRGRYQARSADEVMAMLRRYEDRFAELFGDRIPANAYRVHVSDDDFGCDRERARQILHRLRQSPFRLSSLQLGISDLCRRSGRRLLAEPDERLLEALVPACFADAARPVSPVEALEDYRERSFSSYLQIGVESFCDRELLRLGKGYRVRHVRQVVAALSDRAIHHDAYLILAGSETSGDDLVESLEEASRLKLRHPHYFHLRYPAVRRLVSYFPSASYQRKARAGKAGTSQLRRAACVAGHPEYDYPFVEHDVPQDPWVRVATEGDLLSDGRRYTDSLVALRSRWQKRVRELPAGPERVEGERLVRQLDDAPRRLVLEWLAEILDPRGAPDDPDRASREQQALGVADELLGPRRRWLSALRRFRHEVHPRLVVIPTWECELRCRYCYVAKQAGRTMEPSAMERSVDLLLSSARPGVILQFFGGEPLCRFDRVQHGIEYASARAARAGKELHFIVSSNGYSLDDARLSFLGRHPVRLELSLDGDRATHDANRRAKDRQVSSYEAGIATKVEAIHRSGLAYDVIMVVHPKDVEKTAANFFHIADLGFRRIQLNFGLGVIWSADQQRRFASELHEIGRELRRRWAGGDPLVMVNLENLPMPMRLNGEITVDYDGTIYGGNGFLHESVHKGRFAVGHLDDLGGFDRYWLDAPSNDYLLEWTYPPDVTANNLAVGRIMTSFVRWMRGGADRRS